MYTDAAWEKGNDCVFIGMGALTCFDGNRIAAAGQAPPSFLETLCARDTQITPLELLAAFSALHTFREVLAERLIILFIDNEAACAALASGVSSAPDLQALVSASHFLADLFRMRIWIEWIPSKSNPADELSREGFSKWTQSVERMRLPR